MDCILRVRPPTPPALSVCYSTDSPVPRRYLLFLILTIVFATVQGLSTSGRIWAVVICLIFQLLALAWYVLSYIPFGRDMVKKCFGSMCGL